MHQSINLMDSRKLNCLETERLIQQGKFLPRDNILAAVGDQQLFNHP